MPDDEIPNPDTAKPISGATGSMPKKGLGKDVSTFFKGLTGSIEAANSAVKGFEPKKRRTIGDMVSMLQSTKAGPPYRHCDDYAWAKNVINWSNIDLVILIIFTVIIWFGVYKVNNRQVYNVIANESLDSRIREYRSLPFLDQDSLIMWLVNTLQLLGQASPSGKPFLPGVVSQVNPEIYEKTITAYNQNMKELIETSTIYNLNITKVAKIYVNEEDKRVTVFLQGFITRMSTNPKTLDGRTQSDKVVVPYRAKAIVSQGIASQLSPSGFYLEELTEKLGPEGVSWFISLDLASQISGSAVVAPPKAPINSPTLK